MFPRCLLLLGALAASAPAPAMAREIASLAGPVSLAGSWRFRTGDDPAWSRPDYDDAGWSEIRVPTGWGPRGYDGPRAAFAWYRLTLLLPPQSDETALALSLGKVDSAYEVFASGIRLGGVGALPPQPRLDYDRHGIYSIPRGAISPAGRLVIGIRVWKAPVTNSLTGGLVEVPPLFGPLEALARQQTVSELPQLALITVFLVTGVMHLQLFSRRHQLREYLWFGVMCLQAAAYTFLRTQWKYAISEDFVSLKEIEHALVFTATIPFVQFLLPLLGRPIGPALRGYQWTLVLLALSCLAAPGLGLNLAVLPWWQAHFAVFAAAMLALLAHDSWRRHPEARTIAMGVLALGLCFLSDIAVDRGFYVFPRLLPVGFGAFTVAMSFSLANRFTRAQTELEALRHDLEDRVARRTAELQRRSDELSEANARLEERSRQLLEAARAKSVFLANVSHEIRTPLTGILGMARLLRETRLAAEQQEYADVIQAQGRSLLATINDILDFSKIEAGRLDLEAIEFDLRELLEGIVKSFHEQARAKGLGFQLELPQGLPAAVRGDPVRLRQALDNLLSNAIKFTPAGEVGLRVRLLGSEGERASLRFEVSDTGIGVPADAAPRLFLPFSQADASTTRRYGGTGLGLAITKSLVEKMGGEAGFESEVGKGSRFFFTLRLATAPAPLERLPAARIAESVAPAPMAPTPAGPAAAPVPRSKGRVLVAEDHDVNQRVMLRTLETLGYRADVAATGHEVLEAAGRASYDLVLMDCQMPGMDGFEAARRLRARGGLGDTPIVAITASATAADREAARAAGMDDFLTKPVHSEELEGLLDRWIGRGRTEAAPVQPVTRPGPAAMPASGPLDPRVIGELRALTPSGFLAESIDLFLKSADRSLAGLRAALDESDSVSAARRAHSLRGSCAIIGARPMMELAGRLEEMLRSTGAGGTAPLLAALDAEYASVRTALEAERARLTAEPSQS